MKCVSNMTDRQPAAACRRRGLRQSLLKAWWWLAVTVETCSRESTDKTSAVCDWSNKTRTFKVSQQNCAAFTHLPYLHHTPRPSQSSWSNHLTPVIIPFHHLPISLSANAENIGKNPLSEAFLKMLFSNIEVRVYAQRSKAFDVSDERTASILIASWIWFSHHSPWRWGQ